MKATTAHRSGALQHLKRVIRARLVHQFDAHLPEALIRRAIDEAEHRAVETGFPQLFLPELAAEQVRQMARFVTDSVVEAPQSLVAA